MHFITDKNGILEPNFNENESQCNFELNMIR